MKRQRGSIRKGVLIGIALSIIGILVLITLAASARTSNGLWTYESRAMGALLIIGVTQVLWIAPASLLLLVKKRAQMLKGLLIVAGILFVINAVFVVRVLALRR